MSGEHNLTGLEIAVIGMSCRFPGAENIHEFWENLKNGVESISFFSIEELAETGNFGEMPQESQFIRARGTLADIECFDAVLFGYTPREAELMDPQVRLFHECAYETLEDAGYDSESYDGLIGLLAGAAHNHYWEGLSKFSGKSDEIGQWTAYQLVDKDYMTMRISYALNLMGPSFSLYTACSTSLVAIHLACQAILNGECDMALAGGITLLLPRKTGYIYREGMVMSPDGHCRAFDAQGKGTIFGDGIGIVLLKRLEDALADKDHIYAVIKGSSINNDGVRKSGFTAPSVDGQLEVLTTAFQVAHVEPESIGYVEAHGTGTSLGDPIEVEALKLAFNTAKRRFCGLGSVKSNIGHLDAAAGVAGFIKTVLAIYHRLIPPTLHFEHPNPQIDFEDSPFYVNTKLKEWQPETLSSSESVVPLRAGVSSFGIGGTNVHVVLEEWPDGHSSNAERKAQSAEQAGITSDGGVPRSSGVASSSTQQITNALAPQLILLSAKTESALGKMTRNLAEFFREKSGTDLADAAYTLQIGRRPLNYRRMLVCTTNEEAAAALSSPESEYLHTALVVPENKPEVVFMFSGQGSQYVGMGLELYHTEPVFREEMDRCFEILEPLMEVDIKEILYPGNQVNEKNAEKINQTEITQPLLFIFEYSLAQLLMKWGIKPYAMIGHSIGEYVAACLSGVFSLKDALKLVVLRGKLMQRMPAGAMLSIFVSEGELKTLLSENGNVSLAAVNGPSVCVVSGTHEAITDFERQAVARGYKTRRLHTSHAFHSTMMEPILTRFRESLNHVPLNQPGIPYISNVTGDWTAAEEAVEPGYWVDHMRKTVRFADGLSTLMESEHSVFVEVGPGKVLSTFVRQAKQEKQKRELPVINLVKHPQEEKSDIYFLLDKIGRMWLYGIGIDWQGFYKNEKRQRIPLPTYPFERQYYWIDEKSLNKLPGTVFKRSLSEKKSDITEWFYIPSWKRSLIPQPPTSETSDTTGTGLVSHWLFFMDTCGLGEQLARRFEKESHVIRVRMGSRFAHTYSTKSEQDGEYTINPAAAGDYEALFNELHSRSQFPQRIVHLWNVTEPDSESPIPGDGETAAFFSLLYLAQAFGKQDAANKIHLTVVTGSMQEVTGDEELCPQKAMILGPVKIIPQEYPDIRCCTVDIVTPEPGSKREEKLVEQLAAEFISSLPDNIVAFRSHYRLVQTFEPVHLKPQSDKIPRLREEGVYLITGGLGSIGLELAGYLAESIRAKLILVGRSAFPAREEWDDWLATHEEQDPISQKILKLGKLEETGAEVLVLSGDVADYQQMQQVISRAEARFGPVNGVIHAAGVPGGGVIQLRKEDDARAVLNPKVKGTLVLDRLLKGKPLDFFLLCSSINSILPMVGQVDYAAANAFLDAFACYKTSKDDIFTVSINWDTWQEVGMAVNAVRKAVDHPLLDQYMMAGPDRHTFITRFKLDKHWVLNEHMTVEKKGVLPGVVYLEMVYGVLENLMNGDRGTIEVKDVYFLNPLMVEEGEEREVTLVIERQNGEGEFDFRIKSRTRPDTDTWQNHAVGKIRVEREIREQEKQVIHDLYKIQARCSETVKNLTAEQKESTDSISTDRLLIFGPRWRSLRQVQYGRNQGLAYLELPGAYAQDLECYKLHPALLDTAAGFFIRYAGDGSAYIPFSYKKLKIKAPLRARIFSYSRLIEQPDNEHSDDFLKFDITIMDEDGRELLDIKEFTMLKVSPQVRKKINEKDRQSTASSSFDTYTASTGLLKNGILSSEGIDVFTRILSGAPPRVVVSTTDLSARIENNDLTSRALLTGALEEREVPGTRHPRPELSTAYVAPRTERERKIEAAWQDVLGLEQIGINDDFFELGGDSVSIIRLNSKLKKTLAREISEVILFRYPTIGSFAGYLNRENPDEEGGTLIMDRSEEVKKRKSRLQQQFKRD